MYDQDADTVNALQEELLEAARDAVVGARAESEQTPRSSTAYYADSMPAAPTAEGWPLPARNTRALSLCCLVPRGLRWAHDRSRSPTVVLNELRPQHRALRQMIPEVYDGFGALSKAAWAQAH